MLHAKVLREQLEVVKNKLATRGGDLQDLDSFVDYDRKRRELIQKTEDLKNRRNTVSREIAQMKKAKQDAEAKILEMRQVGEEIKQLDEEIGQLEEKMNDILLTLPNLPHETVPIGASEEENVVVRHWGEVAEAEFAVKPHWEVGLELNILDFERAAKVSGSRYVYYQGLGARLERALINFMLNLHTSEHGYEEMVTPFIVQQDCMVGTGQLPKFAEDAYRLEGEESYLIPTTEVPLVNYFRGEILKDEDLPKYVAGYSPCFRSEAGSAGRDTRGVIRLHQFHKVEMVKLTHPEKSYEELEKLVSNAEKVLQRLELPYRVITLCTGDLGFTATKTYDLEVWLPSQGAYREISSCSNCEDFQARRANIRFRRDAKSKPEFVHTLNGSGLAVDRTIAAILENYQQADGTVQIPTALQPYMGGITQISK
ncbi:serine--tRNA ligase [Thermoflavimicrobium daqui]|uniref:Serine--tRNA ligase n=1 Tax=Thermoflavimicrobium daqui TaxID=2137476 RepID=A0A364K3M2_9BACL|nr:serine--tRNA ligase [Thermoflavimicrobium daqui]RAL23429.1 serine--tRNA ligase [Thermoflavimicrobium daqui]